MPGPPALPGAVALAVARDYASNAHAEATRRAYRADWTDFCSFCRTTGFSPLPAAPETIAARTCAASADQAMPREPSAVQTKSPGARGAKRGCSGRADSAAANA